MLRKLLAYTFLITSLQAQAATAFACEMMGMVTDECCCEMQAPLRSEVPSIDAADSCCTQIATGGAVGASDSAKSAFKALNPDLQPQPLAPAPSHGVLPQQRKFAAFREVPPGSVSQFGTLTYLSTLRLRI